MGRKLGSKNKNINTAKNKNIININVNSSESKRGRPRKTAANTIHKIDHQQVAVVFQWHHHKL